MRNVKKGVCEKFQVSSLPRIIIRKTLGKACLKQFNFQQPDLHKYSVLQLFLDIIWFFGFYNGFYNGTPFIQFSAFYSHSH